jgi:hypothetical protein
MSNAHVSALAAMIRVLSNGIVILVGALAPAADAAVAAARAVRAKSQKRCTSPPFPPSGVS